MHKKTTNPLAQTIEDAPLEQLAHLLKWKHHVKIEKAFLFKDLQEGTNDCFTIDEYEELVNLLVNLYNLDRDASSHWGYQDLFEISGELADVLAHKKVTIDTLRNTNPYEILDCLYDYGWDQLQSRYEKESENV